MEALQEADVDDAAFMEQLVAMRDMLKDNRPSPGKWKYNSYADLLLQHGELRHAQLELPDDVKDMPAKQCYTNAYVLATSDEKYTYVEGYASVGLLAVLHAWVEDDEGRIIDPTWSQLMGGDAVYLGVRFSDEYLMRRTRESGYTGIFESDYMLKCRALVRGFEFEDGVVIDEGKEAHE